MKRYISLIFCIATFVAAASCSFLDTEPKDFVTPINSYSTESEMTMALNGIYATLAEAALYGNNMLGRMGLSADIGYESYSSDYGSVGDYDVSPSDSKILAYWRELYKGINRANMFIKNIDKPKMDSKLRNSYLGQALFLRGYYYFMLVVRFNRIPLILDVVEDSSKEALQIAQSSPKDVYLQIIADMEMAADLVNTATEVGTPCRVSQSTVHGMLAKVCLYMAGYPVREIGMYAKAKEYAGKVIDSGQHSLNPSYEQIFINYIQNVYDIQENLFEVNFYGNNEGAYTNTAGMVGRNNGIGCTNNKISSTGKSIVDMYGYSIGAIRTTPYFYEMFEDGDLRRDWTIANYTYNTTTGGKTIQTTNIWTRYCGKFRREYELTSSRSTNYTSTDFPILRYADVLLVWAEAVASGADDNAGDLEQAWEYVNQVRRRGYGLDIALTSGIADVGPGDKFLLMETIKDERARELGFELTRKDDLVRWGIFYDNMRYLRSVANSIPASYISSYYVNARRYYNNVSKRDEFWPIPAYEMGVNRALEQNPGW